MIKFSNHYPHWQISSDMFVASIEMSVTKNSSFQNFLHQDDHTI